MKELELRYIAHITTLTQAMHEHYLTEAQTLRELIAELDQKYPGFQVVFMNAKTGKLNLNASIYCGEEGTPPLSVIELEYPIKDRYTITFW